VKLTPYFNLNLSLSTTPWRRKTEWL